MDDEPDTQREPSANDAHSHARMSFHAHVRTLLSDCSPDALGSNPSSPASDSLVAHTDASPLARRYNALHIEERHNSIHEIGDVSRIHRDASLLQLR